MPLRGIRDKVGTPLRGFRRISGGQCKRAWSVRLSHGRLGEPSGPWGTKPLRGWQRTALPRSLHFTSGIPCTKMPACHALLQLPDRFFADDPYHRLSAAGAGGSFAASPERGAGHGVRLWDGRAVHRSGYERAGAFHHLDGGSFLCADRCACRPLRTSKQRQERHRGKAQRCHHCQGDAEPDAHLARERGPGSGSGHPRRDGYGDA